MTFGRRHENFVLCLCVGLLALVGAVMVYSASCVAAETSARCGRDAAYYLKRQILFLAAGAAAAVALTRVDYDLYRRRMPWLLGIAFLLLLAVYVPGVGKASKGAARWINARLFTFQPSELAKFVLVAFAAWTVDRAGESPKSGIRPYAGPLLVLAVFLAAVFKEPDLGMTFIIASSFMLVLYAGGFPARWLAGTAAAGAAALAVMIAAQPYRISRMTAFIDPFAQERTAGYAVIQSLIAFSNGGFLGTGIGGGRQKLFYLPEIHTDYIFSVIGEELGFVGVAAVGACFVVVAAMAFRIGRRARDLFGRYLAMGIGTVIGLQALANMMVGLKMLPPKGMVLPFVSYGGSSLVLHLGMVGVLINISMRGAEARVAPDDGRRRRDRRARLSGDRPC